MKFVLTINGYYVNAETIQTLYVEYDQRRTAEGYAPLYRVKAITAHGTEVLHRADNIEEAKAYLAQLVNKLGEVF